ncbi:MAG: hypothetical protein KKA73_26420 [Chloroflexi bacterium]|nr:hypothetical protein [Chloroflexota bacterium]MBU1751235.1 hypothetical protein [Chloroflexota bacterium]MBU1879906.1 hypothetical protein [Chloroflexota bacterium]
MHVRLFADEPHTAIAAATGVRIRDLPLSRERVFRALQDRPPTDDR